VCCGNSKGCDSEASDSTLKTNSSLSVLCFCILYLTHPSHPFAQDVNPQQPISLDTAVDLALSNYPGVSVARAQVAAASANIDLARTSYLPRVDMLYQENRGTRNNIFGQVLPQAVIPSLTGPILPMHSFAGTFGSAGGVLLSWEPLDFGVRKGQLDVARAITNQATVGVEVTRLDVATSAADAFLGTLASQEAARAAESNVSRTQVFADAVHVLVKNGLRAGADSARVDAELSAAINQLNRAQQTTEIGRATLAEALGIPGSYVTIDTGPLLNLPPDTTAPTPNFESHPLALAQKAAVETVRARKHVLDRSYFPRFNLQSSFSGRGSGALNNGQLRGGLHGLLPNTSNYAMGISATFPAFDFFTIRARRRIEEGNEGVERARLEQTIQGLKGQYARAQALIDGALRIAQETPNQLKAAQDAENLTRERYKFGLATVTEVAEVQRLLAQAEVDNAVAHLNVWRALLVAARLQGDLKPFLLQVKH
jgi:outer membrane protein